MTGVYRKLGQVLFGYQGRNPYPAFGHRTRERNPDVIIYLYRATGFWRTTGVVQYKIRRKRGNGRPTVDIKKTLNTLTEYLPGSGFISQISLTRVRLVLDIVALECFDLMAKLINCGS